MTAEQQLDHWQRTAPSYGFVYVIQSEQGGPVKIGKAKNPRERIATLQTASPYPLRLLHVLPGGRPLERQLHERLAPFRLRGEWFDLDPKVLELLALIADVAERAIRLGTKPSEIVALFIETPIPGPDHTRCQEFQRQRNEAAKEIRSGAQVTAHTHPDSPFNPHVERPPTFQPHKPST